MTGGIRLGKLFGIEVSLDYSWFLVFFLMAWSLSVQLFPELNFGAGESWMMGLVTALLFFGSLVLHELAHAVMARRYGVEVTGIRLFLFGGVAQIADEPSSPGVEFLVAVVGPLASIAFGGLCFLLSALLGSAEALSPVAAVLAYLGTINLVLALFNLVPGFPLDGGRILRSIVWRLSGDLRKATHWSSGAGQLFAWLLIGYGLVGRVLLQGDLGGLWLAFIGWFLRNAAASAYQQLLLREALTGIPVSELVEGGSARGPAVDGRLSVAQFVNDYLLREDYLLYPVVQEEECVGVVTLDHVRALNRDQWETTSLAAIAHPVREELTIRADQNAWEALSQMLSNETPRLLVLGEHGVRGVLSRSGIMRQLQRKQRLGLLDSSGSGSLRSSGTNSKMA